MTDRVTTPFGATSTADEVIEGVDLRGRRVVVTGAAGGLGRETAGALASVGRFSHRPPTRDGGTP
jgi:hypothetical protein